MCKIGPKQHKQTTMTSYYVTVIFGLPCESESRFTLYAIPDFLIECPVNYTLMTGAVNQN